MNDRVVWENMSLSDELDPNHEKIYCLLSRSLGQDRLLVVFSDVHGGLICPADLFVYFSDFLDSQFSSFPAIAGTTERRCVL
jgi:hypothetical protein